MNALLEEDFAQVGCQNENIYQSRGGMEEIEVACRRTWQELIGNSNDDAACKDLVVNNAGCEELVGISNPDAILPFDDTPSSDERLPWAPPFARQSEDESACDDANPLWVALQFAHQARDRKRRKMKSARRMKDVHGVKLNARYFWSVASSAKLRTLAEGCHDITGKKWATVAKRMGCDEMGRPFRKEQCKQHFKNMCRQDALAAAQSIASDCFLNV